MGLFSNWFGRTQPTRQMPTSSKFVRARFDAAESQDDRRHWANADWF